MGSLFHMHPLPVCKTGAHNAGCSKAPFTVLNEDSCTNRGPTVPANVRCKCVHSSFWWKNIPEGLPVGTYYHERKPVGFIITRADKARSTKRKKRK